MESKWHFPSTERELIDLIERDDLLIHGGGTGISRERVRSAGSVAALSRMGWDGCTTEGDSIKLGSMATFSKVSEELERMRPGHVLACALSQAASTALRNTVTLGGSIAFFPLWSDLMGPLIALGGKVDLIGASEGVHPVLDYVSKTAVFRNSVIRSVVIPDQTWDSWYYREVRVGFDYPGFTLTLLSKRDGDRISDFKGVVVGTREKFTVLDHLAERIKGARCKDIDVRSLGRDLKPDFPDKKSGSSDYLRQAATVWFERGLAQLLER